jgi:hypothetical protein
VVVTKMPLPVISTQVRVKGMFEEATAIVDQQMLVFVEEGE